MKTLIITLICILSINIKSKAQTEVTFYTTEGTFIAMMYDSVKPITAGNFISLVDSGFYDGIIFHRVIKNFIIQGGDPLGTGFGGPGYAIPDEFDSTGTLSNIRKTLSMANSGPNTGGSQFFINMVNNTYLDWNKAPLSSKHPVFGIVVYNWPVVEAISNVSVNASDRPITDVVMDSVRVTPANIGLNEVLKSSEIHLFPNPVNERTRAYVHSYGNQMGELSVYDALGTIIKRQSIQLKAGNNVFNLGEMLTAKKRSGMYTIVIQSEDQTYTKKILL